MSFYFISSPLVAGIIRGLIFVFLSWSDDAHAARRRYKKDLDQIKPDLVAYNRQKEVAMGLAPGTLVTSFNPTAGSSSSAMQVVPTSQQQQLAAENLYRDANSMLYGDSKPSEDAIDRVVGKINKECVDFIFILFPLYPIPPSPPWIWSWSDFSRIARN